MVGVVRLALGCYCFFWMLRYWYWWRTANLAAKHGGSYGNPFNDPLNFCCVYDAPPCPIDVVCVGIYDKGVDAHRVVLFPAIGPMFTWLMYPMAFGLLVLDDGSGMATFGALLLVGAMSWGWI
jgi:hypothetical protein